MDINDVVQSMREKFEEFIKNFKEAFEADGKSKK